MAKKFKVSRKIRSYGRKDGETSREYRLITHARTWPIYECLINESWDGCGMANILLSRKQPDGNIVFGAYLMDIYCLGLKDTFYNINQTSSGYMKMIDGLDKREKMIDCSFSLAHTIIYKGIEYARSIGFEPHKDFIKTRLILEEPTDVEWSDDVEFGIDGKPVYISGPNDDGEKILRKLEKIR